MAELLEEIGHDNRPGPKIQSQTSSLALQRSATSTGSARLRDAVVYGYIMLRHARQEHVRDLSYRSLTIACLSKQIPRPHLLCYISPLLRKGTHLHLVLMENNRLRLALSIQRVVNSHIHHSVKESLDVWG